MNERDAAWTVAIVGWLPGVPTVSLITAIRDHSGCSLGAAKATVERVLAGERVELTFPERAARDEFLARTDDLRVIVESRK